ncbi:hypothetical protein [Persephonella sp.]
MKLILNILLLFPATFLHELSHILIAFLTFSRVYGISLIPKIEKNRIVLGNVKVVPVFKGVLIFIGLAPLGLLYIAYFILSNRIIIINEWFTYILVFYLILGSKPSKQDLKSALNGLFSISGVIMLFIAGLILKFYVFE